MPPIVVNGRGEKITARHKQHAQEKIRKLCRYFDGIVKMEAVLQNDSGESRAELLISVRGGKTLVCHSRSKELYAAIDLLVDKAEVQLTRHKEKRKDHNKGRSSAEWPGGEGGAPGDRGADEDDDTEERYEDIVEKRTTS